MDTVVKKTVVIKTVVIRIKRDTREKLKSLGMKDETYDTVINKMIKEAGHG